MPEAHRFEKRQQQEREEGYVFGGADESLGPMQDSAPNVGVGAPIMKNTLSNHWVV